MTNLEEAIRERAYHLWTADGLTSSLEGSAETAPVTTGPAKAAKAARSGKKKARAA